MASVQLTVDISPPIVTLLEPSESIVTSHDIYVEWRVIDNFQVMYVELYVNGQCVYIGNDTKHVLSVGSDGVYIICARAYDIAGNYAEVTKTLIVDTLEPTVVITYPYDGLYLNISTIAVTWSYEEENLEHIGIRVDYGEWIDVGGNTSYILELEDGRHIVEVKVYDIAGNIAKDSVIFTIDTTPPTITIIEPENNSVVTEETITIRLYVFDANLDTVLMKANGKWTELKGNEYTVSLHEGENKIWIRATDKAGNTRTVVLIVTLEKMQLMPYVLLALVPVIFLAALSLKKKKKHRRRETSEGRSDLGAYKI